MSRIKHATVSAWQRDHEGTYTAEINGYALKVFWRPEADPSGSEPGRPRGFGWEATSPAGKTTTSGDVHEEIELAMAEAENAAYGGDEGEGVEDAA